MTVVRPIPGSEYTYELPDGHCGRDEARGCERVNTSNSNQVMRKFLADVEKAVCEDRQKAYDVPERNHARTASMATVCLDQPMSSEQVCLFNLCQKLSRASHSLTYDTLLDVAGYAANCAAVMAARMPLNGT